MRRKLTDMVWRNIGEALVLSLLLFFGLLYFLYSNHYLHFPSNGWEGFFTLFFLLLAVLFLGGAFGYWTGFRIKRRLDLLREAMIHMEKGSPPQGIPDLGDDEIGRLARQLSQLNARWEEQVNSLQRLSSHNAELAAQAGVAAAIEERQRLARELHDAVSQQLFAISMTATAVSRTFEKDLEKAKRQVQLIEEMASVAQSEMRALLLHLRPVHLEGKSLSQALIELLQEFAAKLPMELKWQIDEGIRLSRGIEEQLFRITQEALSNTLRHSRATRLEVKLLYRPGSVRLLIEDNGIGFEPNERKQTSYGLLTMRERANEIGGAFHLITAPGKGTRIEIRVPLIDHPS
ncbi:MAG: sensor histidine kinase [Thermicanus sp.]|nr:sensor histidine kinase [Thermicanus sp.]